MDNIKIRDGTLDDIKELVKLQESIVLDHYVRVYSDPAYAHLPISKDTYNIFKKELEHFDKDLEQYIDKNLYVAFDIVNNRIAGYLTTHQSAINKSKLVLDLLMVHKDYRGQGIGKNLIVHSILNKEIRSCILYTLRYNNDKTRTFYENLGFTYEGIGPCEDSGKVSNPDIFVHYKFDKN